MSRLVVVAFLVAALLPAAACKTDWFGNSEPTPTPTGVCGSKHATEAPVKQIPIPVPGRQLMTITAEVRAANYRLGTDGRPGRLLDREWCVPFLYTMIVRVAGLDEIVIVDRRTGRGQASPASGSGKTPWFADGRVLWDRDQAPPLVSVHIEATYDLERDFVETEYVGPFAFRCAISYNGVDPIVMDMKPDARAAGFVRCDFEHVAIPLVV